ncbi:hypothetical protein SLEP1_g31332 [Rubroshorea leprosula]|uniref:BHLH domain-containing protein n=1 Tax=Rubroshorea leprosula TaxID=152421 RepID=A0AAV5K8E6_9ROSI|nr:hypothetical protein SLEP1_g31332 [Rubroshorea leprosula]
MKTERDFHPSFELSHPFLEPADNPQDADFNPLFADGTLQALISLPSDLSPVVSSCNFNFSTHDFPSLNPKQPELVLDSFQPPLPLTYPKFEDCLVDSTQSLDFFSKPLPGLCSLEKTQPRLAASSKRARLDSSMGNNTHTLQSAVQGFNSTQMVPQSDLAKQRRQKVSEKMRSLQKLMPWDKKMDNSTMLEEAYKYVRLLQAQIACLQAMPVSSSFAQNQYSNAGFDLGGLRRLNRQQMLEVLLNSPAAQTILCSQGLCVFSYEQLVLLKKTAGVRKAIVHPTGVLGARVGYHS